MYLNQSLYLISTTTIAYLVITGSHFANPAFYMVKLSFWLMWMASVVLLFVYTLMLARVRFQFYELEKFTRYKNQPKLYFTIYLIKAVVPVLLLHLIIVVLLFLIADEPIMASNFLYNGFLFFCGFVVLYACLLRYFPQLCPVYRQVRTPLIKLGQWIEQHWDNRPDTAQQIVTLSSRINNQELDALRQSSTDILLIDVVLIKFERNEYYAYCTDGNTVILDRYRDLIKLLRQQDWIVQIRRGVWVNAWHFALKNERKCRLLPLPAIQDVVAGYAEANGIKEEELFEISKHLRKEIVSHLANRNNFSTDWLGQYLPKI